MRVRAAFAIGALVASSLVLSGCQNTYEPELAAPQGVLEVVGGPRPFGLPGAKDKDDNGRPPETEPPNDEEMDPCWTNPLSCCEELGPC